MIVLNKEMELYILNIKIRQFRQFDKFRQIEQLLKFLKISVDFEIVA